MYADRVEAGGTRSVKERLNGNAAGDLAQRRPITGKRQRRNDDKWEHDLYEDNDVPQVSSRRIGAQDLRLKLKNKGILNARQSGKGTLSGVRDLRDKLSGTIHSQPASYDPPKAKSVVEAGKPTKKPISEAPPVETRKAANPAPRKKKKIESVVGFLESLGLEKYSISFEVEEVDMTTLIHMSDEDLKALGIPMGPRKKILLALDSGE